MLGASGKAHGLRTVPAGEGYAVCCASGYAFCFSCILRFSRFSRILRFSCILRFSW